MSLQLDNRQSRQRSVLDQLDNNTNLRLDTILNLINDELTMPLRLRKNASASDRRVYIGDIEVQTIDGSVGTGRKRTIQPISNMLPSFTAGYLEFPSATGGSITSNQGASWFQSTYTLTLASGQYMKVMIALDSQGKVVLSFGTAGASEAAATMPIALSGTLPIGYVVVQNVSGTIQNMTDANIHQFAGGGGGGGSGASAKQITQNSHGFNVGNVLYLNGSTYALAKADVAATAEAIGVVSSVITPNMFEVTELGYVSGLSGLTAGKVYFLSGAVAGLLTDIEPNTIGYVSKPMFIADSATSGYVLNYRGSVVGGANARSQVSLANNATTNVQLVSSYDAGELVGWVDLQNSTPANSKKFYIQIQFAKNGPGSDYNVAYQTSGDTPPAGFSVDYSTNNVRITLPNISGLTTAYFNYALNAPAVGTNFPLSVDSANVQFGTIQAKDTNGISVKNAAGSVTNVFFKDDGKVGIGTNSPAAQLQSESTGVQIIARNTSNANTAYTATRLYNDTNSSLRALEIAYASSTYSGSLIPSGPTGESGSIATSGAFPLSIGTNNTARMTIDSAGNVGIGTASPGSRLHVTGTIKTDTLDDNTANNGVQIKGRAGNTGISAGYIGQKLDFTSVSIAATTSAWTSSSTIVVTLTAGIWVLYPYADGNSAASLTGYQVFLSTNSTNDSTGNIGVTSVLPSSATVGYREPMIPTYYAVASSTPLYFKAATTGAAATVAIAGFAIRIA